MNAERIREFLLTLPDVVETAQWGGLVFWVGDKAVGGKMFVLLNLEPGELPISYAAGSEHMAELLEMDGIRPAPYMARIFWVAAERWDVHRMSEWQSELTAARDLTYGKLPEKVKVILASPRPELKRIVRERREVLAAEAAAKKASRSRTHISID